nr:hypothetical protein [uncultured Vibrio sp.]
MGVCRLCHNEAVLQRSHVIPKSLLKDVKDGESQLHTFEHQALPSFSNSDPKELLMCRACEQFLSRNYEQYGTKLLKNRKNVIQHPDHIEFREFDYKKWYLYYLSIIWRASISSLNEFNNVDLGGLNEVLKNCILNNTLLVSDLISIDEFVVISMFRVTDKANKLPDAVIKKIMMHFYGITEGEDHLFFFMANGFLIQYQVTTKFMYQKAQGFNRTDIARNKHRYVKRLDITESRVLYENFNWLMEQI